MNFDELIHKIDPTHDYTLAESSRLTGLSYTAINHRVKTSKLPHRVILNRKYIKGSDLISAMSGKCKSVK